MKRKMFGAASVLMTAAAFAMPATAPAQIEDAVAIDNSCLNNGVIDCAINLIRYGADEGAKAYNKVCVIVFGPSRC